MLTLPHTHRSRRGSSTGAVLLALFGTLVALATAGYVVYRDPPGKAKTDSTDPAKTTTSAASNLSRYDFSSAEAALRSEYKIQLTGDVPALLELQAKTDRKVRQEALDTLDVKRAVDFEGKKVVFLTYRKDGKEVKETHWYRRDPDAGMWIRTEPPAKVREKDPKLAGEIQAWR
jgi:hypothetical protein